VAVVTLACETPPGFSGKTSAIAVGERFTASTDNPDIREEVRGYWVSRVRTGYGPGWVRRDPVLEPEGVAPGVCGFEEVLGSFVGDEARARLVVSEGEYVLEVADIVGDPTSFPVQATARCARYDQLVSADGTGMTASPYRATVDAGSDDRIATTAIEVDDTEPVSAIVWTGFQGAFARRPGDPRDVWEVGMFTPGSAACHRTRGEVAGTCDPIPYGGQVVARTSLEGGGITSWGWVHRPTSRHGFAPIRLTEQLLFVGGDGVPLDNEHSFCVLAGISAPPIDEVATGRDTRWRVYPDSAHWRTGSIGGSGSLDVQAHLRVQHSGVWLTCYEAHK
jgi:hypothetical protein